MPHIQPQRAGEGRRGGTIVEHPEIFAPFGWILARSHPGDLMPPVITGQWAEFAVVASHRDTPENRQSRAEQPLFDCQDLE